MGGPSLNAVKIKEFIETTVSLLHTLKFDKLFGKFMEENDITKEIFRHDMKLLEGNTNIVLSCQDCPCCLEPTMSKTMSCNHPLCLPCFQKIQKISCDGDCDEMECDGHHRLCPLCKQIM
jgi:hypothetical protein